VLPRRVLVLFALALLVRVAAAPFLPHSHSYPGGLDPNCYRLIAESIASGGGYNLDLYAHDLKAFYPPVYSTLLAFIPVWLLNPAIDLSVAATLLALGRSLKRDAFWPAAVYLFWPQVILNTLTPQKDTLAILLVCQVALWALRIRSDCRGAIAMGICGGLLALTQPAFAPFTPVLFAFLCWGRWCQGAIVAASMLLVLLPWWIRNWLVFGAFVPLTTATGYNLLVAASGHYTGFSRFVALGELEGSRAATRASVELWRDSPLEIIFHRIAAPGKALLMDRAFYDQAHWMPDFHRLRDITFWPAMIYWWGILALFLLNVRRAPPVLWLILLACCVELAVFNFWFEFGERHRYLLVPFLLLAVARSGDPWLFPGPRGIKSAGCSID
jgi:hypothetical protein